jgi:cytochrome d ubiquinol oxidase subunit I
MFAFLIEAGFLGVLLFGWNKVSPKMHFMSTILVAVGAHFSAIWIVSFNSWMQTPAGFRLTTLVDGVVVAEVADWWKVFLSPSNLSHLTHVILGCWMAGAFLIISVAYYISKGLHADFARRSMKIGLLMAMITAAFQLVSADNLTRKVATFNPEKFAAFEGVYKTEPYTPAYAFGWVDGKNETVYGLSVPGLLSFMTYRDAEKPVRGLDQFPTEEWSNVPIVFQMYHLMIFMWALMAAAAFIGGYYWWKKRWNMNPFILKFMMLSVAFPQIANIAGWYSSCIGRQPYLVYKLLKTKEGFSPVISAGQVLGSLIMFVIMYLLFFVLFLVLLDRKIKAGPAPEMDEEQLPYRDIYKKSPKRF